MIDARFEDGAEQGLSLRAETVDDVAILSALLQDAVFPIEEMRWDRKGRRLALLVNRFRWEDREAAERSRRPYERTRALLVIGGVTGLASQGIDRLARDTILSILSLEWEEGPDGTGRFLLILAGDGAVRATVECIDVTLRDVTRPYVAPSHHMPHHPD